MSFIVRTLATGLLGLGIAAGHASTARAADDIAALDGSDALTGVAPLAKDDLKQLAGGSGLSSYNLASNESTVTGNTIGDIGASGGIGQNTLSGTSGLTTFIANSGNQVVISQSTVVNVYLH